MKKKLIFGLSGGTLLSLLVVGIVMSFAMGNADGVWQYVEDDDTTQNAFCTTYGTGQGTNETAWSRNNPSIQGALGGTDENQVHYGKGSSLTENCPTTAPTSNWFDAQSGLGFDGNNNVGSPLLEGDQFWIGRITHYNRPIYLSDTGGTPVGWEFMEWTDIDINVTGILCSNGQPPNEGSSLTFSYRINFDETPNNASPCQYPDGPNQNGCSDAVTLGTNPPAASFTCDDANEPVKGIYTITLLGVQPHTSDNCSTQAYNSSLIVTQFLTAENATNHACLWAQISDFEPTAVTLNGLSALAQEGEVEVSWETTSEIGTMGFNLYRATSEDGERSLVNDELIISNLAPGSLDGATYTFTDKLGSAGDHYWLEEVEFDGTTMLYGPVIALAE
jgi:hypothetical protein